MPCFKCGSEEGTSAQLCPNCVEENKASHKKSIEEVRALVFKCFEQKENEERKIVPGFLEDTGFKFFLIGIVVTSLAYFSTQVVPELVESNPKPEQQHTERGIGVLKADFHAEPREGESPLLVELFDTSTGAFPSSWHWEIIGSSWTSDKQNPLIDLRTKNPEGWKVSIRLTVKADGQETSKLKEDFIKVYPRSIFDSNGSYSLSVVIESVAFDEDMFTVAGIASGEYGVRSVAYCVEQCNISETLWTEGTDDWSVSLSLDVFEDSERIKILVFAEDKAGNWSRPVSRVVNRITMDFESQRAEQD